MSYKFEAPNPQTGPDVDFDFFDDPQDRKSPTNLGSSGKWSRCDMTEQSDSGADKNTRRGRSKNENKSKTDPSPRGKKVVSPKVRNGQSSHSHGEEDSNSSESDYTDDELYTSTETSEKDKDVRKIEAKIPSAHDGRKADGKKNDNLSKKPKKSSDSNRHGRTHSYSSDSAHSALSESDYSTDTDSDVTDVSPLNSPHTPASAAISRRSQDTQRSALKSGKPPKSPGHKEVTFRRPPSAGSSQGSHQSPLTRADSDNIDFKLLMQAVIEMEGRSGELAHGHSQTEMSNRYNARGSNIPKQRKNMSFNNDNVWSIDRENQRLMHQIMSQSRMAKQKKQAIKRAAKVPATNRVLTTSAINRNKEQKRIERENLAMLQRLQHAKPSKALAKEKLFEDYEQQVLFGYPVAAAHPLPKKKTVASRAPSPYIVPFDPQLKSRSMTNLADASSEMSGFCTPNNGRKPRPASATIRSARPHSASPQKRRPQSAKLSGSRGGSAHITAADCRPAWDDRW